MRTVLTLLALTQILSGEEKISFADHVLPIFEQSCLNCHNPDKTKGGLDLSNFAGAMKGGSSGKVVEPGDTSSTLINLVRHSAEPKMPPEGEKLSSAQIAILTKWIDGGLLENQSSQARRPSKPKFETTLRSDPSAKPDGPPPMPEHLLLEPTVVTERASAVHAIATSPWAPLLAVTGQKQVLLHNTESLELVGILPFPEGDPISLSFTPDARYLIVGGGIPGKSGLTVTFDIETGSRILHVGKEFDSILAADIRPSFDIVATGGPSKLLKLWNTQTGERIRSIKKHTDWITALDISSDGILLASGDRNGGVWVWESETANEFHTLRAHQASITGLSFRSDSNLLATASEDGSVRFWEMNNGNEVKKIDAHAGGVTAFAFAKDGSFITAGRNLEAKLWKPDFSPLLTFKIPAQPTAAAIDWENKRAFVADALGYVHVVPTSEKKTGELESFSTNPPTIETRLKQITTRIRSSYQDLKLAETQHTADTDSLANADLELKSSEKALKQAMQILQASQKGVSETTSKHNSLKSEPGSTPAGLEKAAAELLLATKTFEAAKARIEPAKTAIQKARETLQKARESAKISEEKVTLKNTEIDALKAREKSWSAAAINTHALKAGSDSRQYALETENLIDSFHQALTDLAAPATAVAAKRKQRDSFEKAITRSGLPEAHLNEARATLLALDASLRNDLDRLRELESMAAAKARQVDTAITLSSRSKSQSKRLSESYLRALK